ncbi:MAG: glycosyltransferase family 2 protein [Roseiarcus sp.]
MRVAVVIPSYRVTRHIVDVVTGVLDKVDAVYVIDDKCPDGSGDLVERSAFPPHVKVLRHAVNQGVGGAVITGYRAALADGCDIVVKMDGDGQMDPAMLPRIIHPIVQRLADFSKGNRFFNVEDLHSMPAARLFGNAGLSFLTKLSSGYWTMFDPTNGYTAIHRAALELLPLDKIDRRFFFESDLLFRLNIAGAVVIDVPIRATYGEETSNLRIGKIVGPFLYKNMRNFFKRIVYRYFLRDMNLGSLELAVGTLLLLIGGVFGVSEWVRAGAQGVTASAGTVMLAGLPILVGVQMILGFLAFDIAAVPKVPLQMLLGAAGPDSPSNSAPY